MFVIYAVLSVRPYRVTGDSMMPNFTDKNIVITDRIATHIFPLKRGDVIVYRDMTANGEVKIKRIIGLPLEKLQISEGKVMLMSGELSTEIEERYLEEHTHTCLP